MHLVAQAIQIHRSARYLMLKSLLLVPQVTTFILAYGSRGKILACVLGGLIRHLSRLHPGCKSLVTRSFKNRILKYTMKTIIPISNVLLFFALAVISQKAFSRQFVNLDFESANLSGYSPPNGVPASDAVPGWTAYVSSTELTTIGYDVLTLVQQETLRLCRRTPEV